MCKVNQFTMQAYGSLFKSLSARTLKATGYRAQALSFQTLGGLLPSNACSLEHSPTCQISEILKCSKNAELQQFSSKNAYVSAG